MQGYFKHCDADGENCVEKPILAPGQKRASLLDFATSRRNSSEARPQSVKRRPGSEKLAVDPDDWSMSFAAEDLQKAPQIISIEDGDVLSLESILALAGKSLDETWEAKDGGIRDIRTRGIAVVVNIEYQNLKRWTLFKPNDPWYTISVKAMPAREFKSSQVEEHRSKPNAREMKLSYGTMVIIEQTGYLAFFNPIFALMSLTSAMALLAVSTTLTELLMLSVLPRKEEYSGLKYLESKDFNEAEEKPAKP